MTEQTLVEQALHLPRSEARRWRHTPLDQEDLVADGYLALAKAARRYDPSYDVPFTAFARPYVRGAITDVVRARARRERLGDGTFADVVGFPDLSPQGHDGATNDYEPPDPGPSPHDTVVSLERLRTLATLPESERIALVRTIVDGAPAAEVAKDMGISPHRVYALVNTGSARVRKRAA
jgi:RNA polymerase sigma-B factor